MASTREGSFNVMARRRREAIVAALVVATCCKFLWQPPPRPAPAPRSASKRPTDVDVVAPGPHDFEAVALPATPFAAHDQTWALYDAFASSRDGCATATLVAQFEGDETWRFAVLKDVGLDGWAARRGAARSLNIRRGTRDAAARAFERRGGAPRAVECAFGEQGRPPGPWVPAAALDGAWAKHKSTLVVECAVPPEHRAAACRRGGAVEVRAREAGNDTKRPHPAVPLLLQRPLFADGDAPRLGACAWTRGDAFLERRPSRAVGDRGREPSAARKLAEWLAFHRAAGVGAFRVYDNSAGVHGAGLAGGLDAAAATSPLRPATAPLAARRALEVHPWPEDQALDRAVAAATEGHLTAQSFFGRPSQYAAMNSCHRRMRAAGAAWVLHADVDEYAVPARGDEDLADVVARRGRADGGIVDAYTMPSLFYARCPGEEGAAATLLGAATCAGKATMHRGKLLASADRVHYVWAHYVYLSASPKKKDAVAVLDPGDDARLVHVRAGYDLGDPFAARYGAASAEDRHRYAATVTPRLSGATGVSCDDAPTAPPVAVPKARSMRDRIRNEALLPLTRCDDKAPSWLWCWCRDARAGAVWGPRVAAMLGDVWGAAGVS